MVKAEKGAGSHEMITPAASSLQVIVLIWRGVCPASLHCALQEVSVPCHKDVISSVLSGIQGDCKENGLEQRQIQNGGRDAKLLLFLVNLCTQVRSQCFSAKTV
jgi:hypothetical protein